MNGFVLLEGVWRCRGATWYFHHRYNIFLYVTAKFSVRFIFVERSFGKYFIQCPREPLNVSDYTSNKFNYSYDAP